MSFVKQKASVPQITPHTPHTHTHSHTHTDLYGLVLFLNMELYSETMWYRRLITESYMQRYHEPMINLFASIMWRNTKDDVAHEVKILCSNLCSRPLHVHI